MKSINTIKLIAELLNDVEIIIETVENSIAKLDNEALNYKPNPEAWSPLECLAHLNIANRIYIERMDEGINQWVEKEEPAKNSYKPGILGNYFAKMMKPTENQEIKSKMKTMRMFFPDQNSDTIVTFLAQQKQLLLILEKAKRADLDRIKIKSALGGWLMFKLGDAFRFVVGHSQRHVIQALNAIPTVSSAN